MYIKHAQADLNPQAMLIEKMATAKVFVQDKLNDYRKYPITIAVEGEKGVKLQMWLPADIANDLACQLNHCLQEYDRMRLEKL